MPLAKVKPTAVLMLILDRDFQSPQSHTQAKNRGQKSSTSKVRIEIDTVKPLLSGYCLSGQSA